MLALNLALLFVFKFAPLQFRFRHGENLFHRVLELFRWLLLVLGRCRHDFTISPNIRRLQERNGSLKASPLSVAVLCRMLSGIRDEHARNTPQTREAKRLTLWPLRSSKPISFTHFQRLERRAVQD